MFIEEAMFNRYERSSISDRVIKRIFDGAGRPLSCFPVTSPRFKSDERIEATRNRRMGYLDFIYFILANEHKMLPTSIEYWFRVLDTDGDGVLSLWEIRCFWEEQFDRMIGREMSDPWKFEDFVCGL